MAVSPQDCSDYLHGLADRNLDPFTRAILDIRGAHPTSAAYYLGRKGESLECAQDDIVPAS